MRNPKFWQLPSENNHPAKITLQPVGFLYSQIVKLRLKFSHSEHIGKPVICVGNFTVGGSGKTPITLKLAEHLALMGEQPSILSKGYGGNNRQALKVDPKLHHAKLTGDEPYMMAHQYPVYIAPNRRDAAKLALKDKQVNPTVLIMDDGMQSPNLHKSLTLAVIDRQAGFGNGAVFPAGPLRENIDDALSRIDAIIINGPFLGRHRADVEAVISKASEVNIPVFETELVATNTHAEKVVAFCGIGRPTKFYSQLEQLGYDVQFSQDFDDHHYYSEQDAANLLALAEQYNAQLVTTRKDAVRLEGFDKSSKRFKLAEICKTLDVVAMFSDDKKLEQFLIRKLSEARKSKLYAAPGNN